jgi:hypothetical protein
MIRADSIRGRFALAVAHCAGLLDMVALPIWVGALMQYYHFDSERAGLLVTLFLAGAVAASVVIAPMFHWMSTGQPIAFVGFILASIAYWSLARTTAFGAMAAIHCLGGVGVGMALSVTHGTIARSDFPLDQTGAS